MARFILPGLIKARKSPLSIAVTILLVLGLIASTPSSGLALAGSSFEANDGNLVVNGGAGAKDWANIGISCVTPIAGCGLDLVRSQSDDAFGQGTKEDTEVPSVVDGSIPNNKSDLHRFYIARERITSGSVVTDFLYLAWERVQDPNGTTNMDFELNQGSTVSGNGVTPVRTAGDVLIKYDLSRGGTHPTLGFHTWVTSGSSSQCEASNSLPCWNHVTQIDNVNFEASINDPTTAGGDGSVTDPINPNAPRTLTARTFGEAAINLTAAGILPPGSCRGFATAYVKSRSSDSFSSEVKDFIAPIPVSIVTCGRIKVVKEIDADPNDPQTFRYTTTGTDFGGPNHNFLLDDNATSVISDTFISGDLNPGNYSVAEGAVSGWNLPSTNPLPVVTYRADAGSQVTVNGSTANVTLGTLGDVTITYTNKLRYKIIVVVCQATGVDTNTNAYSSLVTLGNQSLSSAAPGNVDAESLCNSTGGANFGDKIPGVYTTTVDIPVPQPIPQTP